MAFSTSELIPAGIAGFKKAIAGALTAGLAVLINALVDGSVSLAEWKEVGLAMIGGGLGTWAIPNTFLRFRDPQKAIQVANNSTVPPVL